MPPGRPRKTIPVPVAPIPQSYPTDIRTDGHMLSVQLWIRVEGASWVASAPAIPMACGVADTPDKAVQSFKDSYKVIEEARLNQIARGGTLDTMA
jgi:predicted RNase H-like HicB family nuclease